MVGWPRCFGPVVIQHIVVGTEVGKTHLPHGQGTQPRKESGSHSPPQGHAPNDLQDRPPIGPTS
jgi:hypothetical protein